MSEDWNYWKLGLIGIIGGFIAGIVMWIVMTIVTVIGGQGAWAMPKWVGDVVTGDSWQGFNATDVFTGLIIHLIVAMLLGALFGVVVLPFVSTPRQSLIAGVIWGAIVWLLLGLLIVAAVDPTMSQEVPLIPWLIVNLLYGLVVAFIVSPLRSTAQVRA
ncbi:MAG TPA: hypothetical protein VGP33_17750 [Chloroflexota bacterium]|jgi:uncharacterized protein YacL|nr:hypothetical protein [Chloroflexota bacterium]